MGRVEENKKVRDYVGEQTSNEVFIEAALAGNDITWKMSLATIACYLEDISMSLAVIADSMQQGEKDGGDS